MQLDERNHFVDHNPLHEAEENGNNTHEASDARNVKSAGSAGRGGARAAGG